MVAGPRFALLSPAFKIHWRLDHRFNLHCQSKKEEPQDESVSEVVLPQEQDAGRPVVDQGSQEHLEQFAGTGSPDSGYTPGASDAPRIDGDGTSTSVEQVAVAQLDAVKQILTTVSQSPAIGEALAKQGLELAVKSTVDFRSSEPPNDFGEIPYNGIERV